MRDYIKLGCKECGSPHVREKNGKLHCVSCGTWFEKNVETDEERDARILYLSRLDRAEELLRLSPPRFDEAEDHFKDFIRFYPNYSDGYWGLVRARYGIKYEVDTNGKAVPCCYKSSYEDFRKDSDFKRALSCAENDKIYGNLKEQAELIAGVCEEWRKEAGKYNYDIFISFKGKNEELKISDEDQREMNDLYDFLKDEGYSVFFSPRSMHKHTGMYYDAYIFSALQSAKVMIVYGSNPEYFTSTWVQNEWTRFLRMVDNGEKKMGSCIVVYNGFNPYELPHDLRRIQAVDASQRRFYIDVLNSVKKILSEEKKVDTNEELMKQIEALKRQIERDQESNRLKREEKTQIENEKKAAEKEMEALSKKHNDLLEENRKLEAQAKKEYEERKKVSEQKKNENDDPHLKNKPEAKPEALNEKKAETNSDFEIVDGCLKKYKGKKTEVIIPEGITSIGNYAFFGCLDIVDVKIPSGVTHIGNCAFSCCASLPKMTIPGSVTHIGENAFSGCSKLEIFVDDLSRIKNWNAKWNPDNRSVKTIEQENKKPQNDIDFTIVNGCLIRCRGCQKDIVIPDGVTSIGKNAFKKRQGLTSIIIPNSVTSIDDSAFSGCTGLTSVIIPDSVTSIGNSAFSGCSNLTDVVISKNVTAIGDSVFSECSKISRITIPNNVTSIGNSAFSGCSNLADVVIPDSVTFIGDSAFEKCINLADMTIPRRTYSIGDSAFAGCFGLSKVVIGNSVTHISRCAFYGCSGLTSVTMGDNVAYIGDSAFQYCYRLTGIKIPDSVASIGESVFYGCSRLSNVTIGKNVDSISRWAFYDCSSLENIVIPDSVTSIGYEAFSGCYSLASIDIPNSVTSIAVWAFARCSILTVNVYNLDQIKKWSTYWNPDNRPVRVKEEAKLPEINPDFDIIDGCLKKYKGDKTQIIIPNGVTSIAGWAFVSLTPFSSVVVSDTVTRIEKDAFYMCDKLSRLVIGSNVTYIGPSGFGNSMFIKLSRLSSVVFKDAEGWYVSKSSSGTDLIKVSADDLKDASTAATYFKNQYRDYHWFKI